jgi:hypothetical protein
MENIRNHIKDKRPSLSHSSITTYTSVLKNLYKRVFGDEKFDMEKFNQTDKVLEHLKDVPSNKRKTILSALVIITNKKDYRDLMLDDVKVYNDEMSKQQKSDQQKENWVDTDAITNVFENLQKNAMLVYKKKFRTSQDLQLIQSFILLACFVYIPPRRSKDFVDFKIKNIDKDKDNYMEKNTFVFNSYKTSKFYGKQVVQIPVKLRNIIQRWIKINPTEYLFFDSNFNQLSSVKLNQRLNKIFGGMKVSVNMLRHAYLTDKYSDTLNQQKEMKETMNKMGSSLQQADVYIKED